MKTLLTNTWYFLGSLFALFPGVSFSAQTPTKPDFDISNIVDTDDGADQMLMSIISYGGQAIIGIIFIVIFVGFFWNAYSLYSQAIDQNEQLDMTKAMAYIVVGLFIVIFALAGLYFAFDYTGSLR